ncbi:molecular chaperone HtpG [Radicibacter daui]|uniref:molecular chaperone HtpG n=1 Tax=Radicibacter daui TaxID=3064829 RepID=UPI004046C1CA
MTEQTLSFQAEVSRLLDIVANALYSEKEVFLRELISNASDACDKRRHLALTEHALAADGGYAVRLTVDTAARTLTVADNGIGMSRDELVENLGTIARSGTGAFAEKLTGDAKKDVSLIGQFGVGFYAAFMVADKVSVLSRRAGESQSWLWSSDGRSGFTIGESEEAVDGTRITLHLKEGQEEFLDRTRLQHIVRKYSDHIGLPVKFGEGEAEETLNSASALWTRSRSEITEEQYGEFYRHVSHDFAAPWETIHWRAEGVLEYTGLLYIPGMKPFDLYDPKREHHVKLYVRRVFITDKAEGLVPPWLRFLRGVIDSEDLPLNISREMLQANPVVAKIRAGLVKRVLGDLARKAEADAEGYATFWENFGAVLKEGLHDDPARREDLFKVIRFRSTAGEGLVSVAEYVARMKEGQEAIYFITGDDIDTLGRSAQLEGFRARGVEVLLLADPVDEFWTNAVQEMGGKPLKSVTRGSADLGAIKEIEEPGKDQKKPDAAPEDEISALIAVIRDTLGETVKDVRVSERLTESACCLVAEEGDMDMHLARLLRQHKQLEAAVPRVLEINPRHALIRALAAGAVRDGAATALAGPVQLLLDQARIQEGEPPADPVAFASRLADVMARALG